MGNKQSVRTGGTVLAVVAGLVSYFGGPRDVVLGVVVGLQVQALAFLLEILMSINSRDERLGRSAKLMARIESVPELESTFDRMSLRLAAVQQNFRGTIAPEEARRILHECESQLKDLSIGYLYRDSYDPSLKMELLSRHPGLLRTTSVQAHDLAWHTSDVGRAYWLAQVAAIDRGWRIERIFLYDHWIEELDDLAQQQAKAGVKVMRVQLQHIPRELQLDFTLWDDKHAYQQWIRRNEGIYEDKFSVEKSDIADFEHRWERLASMAEVFLVDSTEATGTPTG